MSKTKKIVKNTILLYLRMFFVTCITLYTSRVILTALGVEDYGIYNVVGGLVAMFTSINITMASSVQRFMNFEMGRNDNKKLNRLFNSSVIVHIFLAFLLGVFLEIFGIWFLNNKMNISTERLSVANFILHLSILSFIISILTVPFQAAVMANEKMNFVAIIGVLEALLKVLAVYIVTIVSIDKLSLYSFLIFIITLFQRLCYCLYSIKKFKECKLKLQIDKNMIKDILRFASWNSIDATSYLVKTQGINIVLNIFFNTLINAAMGIALQVAIAIRKFVDSFMSAMTPQIVKSYASNDLLYFWDLVFKGSKYAFFLVYFITLPVLLETEFILKLWLKSVPDFTILFVKLYLIIILIESLSKTLVQAILASGMIKKYQVTIGIINLSIIPLSIIFLHYNFPPYTVLIIGIAIAIVSLLVRLSILIKILRLDISSFCNIVIYSVLSVSITSSIIPILVSYNINESFYRFLLVGLLSVICNLLSIFYLGLTKRERVLIIKNIKKKLKIGEKSDYNFYKPI